MQRPPQIIVLQVRCPSMLTQHPQVMKSRGLLNIQCQCLQIRFLNSAVATGTPKLPTQGAKVAALNLTQTSKCKCSFNCSNNRSLPKLPQQSSCLSKSKNSRKLCMQAPKTLVLLLFPIYLALRQSPSSSNSLNPRSHCCRPSFLRTT